MLPAATMAGTMAMGMLPMIASALAGLGSGSGGNSSGNNSGGSSNSNGGSSGDGETDTETSNGLSPESQRALKALKLLAEVYGDGDSTDPQVKALRQELGTSSGSGAGASAIKARQLFQRNGAKAFNNLDHQLASYLTGLASKHKVDKKAVIALVREVNVALADLGPQAYTKAGQQKVHQILTAALQKGHAIVSGGQSNTKDTAAAINRLTNQYLYNISGKNYTPPAGAKGSPAAQKAIATALAQTGKPYVWGATGPNSFDCSGLMQYAAAAAGVKIPRVSEDQYSQLPKVNPSDIRPGDLIFPSSSFDSNGRPGHVMMYIGNGKCMAASRTGVPLGQVSVPSSFRATRWTS